jgi:alpha-N-acetylglucosamine transferase
LRFVCFTDDVSGLRDEIETHPIPDINIPMPWFGSGWRKISLFRKDLIDLENHQVLFLDLDVLVTDSIDGFFDYKPEEDFLVSQNWTTMPKPIGNTSCFRLKVGSNAHLLDMVHADFAALQEKYNISQVMTSYNVKTIAFWPDEWCASFKHSLLPKWPLRLFKAAELPKHVKMVAFTGKPDIHDVIVGKWPAKWYKKFYKTLRRPDWIEAIWRE